MPVSIPPSAAEQTGPPSEQGGDSHGPGDQDRDRRGFSALAAWLLIVIAGLGMLISSPPSAGPDEPSQEMTAWYLSGHGLRPNTPESFSVPVQFSVIEPCFLDKQTPDLTASCLPPRSTAEATASTTEVLNYPPPYYLAVGVGERLAAALVGIEYADLGARIASFILNFGALLLLSLYMRRRDPRWGSLLLLVSMPMAVFLGAVVNPSGWEITCGVVMAAVLSGAVRGRESLWSEAWPRVTVAALVVTSVALSLARPLGFFWVSGLTVTAIAVAPSINRRLVLRVASAVAPGIALGILWLITHSAAALPVISSAGGAPSGESTSFAASFVFFPLRLFQMFGVLGWLDTPMPGLLLLGNLLAWGVLLRRMPSVGRGAKLCGIFGIVIAPSLIESTINIGGTGLWWQGRYTLPFALGFVLLMLLRSDRLIPRTISIASSVTLLSLGMMVWVNAIRYDFGLNNYDLPLSFAHPGLSPVQLTFSAAIGAVLVLASGYAFAKAWRMKPDRRSSLDPETPSYPPETPLANSSPA
jgi:hypothetical protein